MEEVTSKLRRATSIVTFSTFLLLPLLPRSQSQPDPDAQFQLATRLYEEARYREALDAYDLVTRADDAALVTRAGANALVAGSAVFKGGPSTYRANIDAIRNAAALARGEAA